MFLEQMIAMDSGVLSKYISRFGGMEPTTRSVQEDKTFADEFTALLAALNYFNPLSVTADVSFSGVVYRSGERFAFSGSVLCAGSRTLLFSPVKIADGVVAFWRTSGQMEVCSRYFSDTETALANAHDIPFYLANHTGQLKVFTPGSCTLSIAVADRLVAVPAPGFALGRLVHDKFERVVKIGTRLQLQHFIEFNELVDLEAAS